MKRILARDLQRDVESVLNSAQKERIVISRGGKPCAVILGIENYDAEDLRTASSPEFWRMIQRRRSRGRSIPLAEVEARLEKKLGGRPAKQQSASKKARNRS